MTPKRTSSELDDAQSQSPSTKRLRISINVLLNDSDHNDQGGMTMALSSVERMRRTGKDTVQQRKFPFDLLPAEIRNMIYELVIDDHFEDKKKNLRLDNPRTAQAAFFEWPRHGIPYGIYGEHNFRGVLPEHLPPFENFLGSNKKLYTELTSTRISRSELVIPPRLSHDGVSTTYEHQRLKIGELDSKYTEQLTYHIGRTEWHSIQSELLETNQVIQSRIFALGTALKCLATDTKLANISRVCIQIKGVTLRSRHRGRVLRRSAWARYDWRPVVDGLRTLIQSSKIRVFELRCDEWTRGTERIDELQGVINKLLGMSAEIEGKGCSRCQLPADEDTHGNWQHSMVWKVPKGKSLMLKDSETDLERWDCFYCHECGDAPLWVRGYEEEDIYVYEGGRS